MHQRLCVGYELVCTPMEYKRSLHIGGGGEAMVMLL